MYKNYKIQGDGTPKYDGKSYTIKPERRIYKNTDEWNRRLQGGKTYKLRRRRNEVDTVKQTTYATRRRNEVNKHKKSLSFAIGEVLTLLSAIFNTYVLCTLIPQSSDIFTMFLYCLILIFVWVGRYKSLKDDHKGWMVYSLIVGCIILNPLDMVGYIFVLIYSFKHR